MATKERIAFELQKAFRPYVSKKNLPQYEKEFSSRKMYTSKFIEKFFPKYIDFKKYWKEPKETHHSLLFNYFLIEIPEVGVESTAIFWRYLSEEKKFKKNKLK